MGVTCVDTLELIRDKLYGWFYYSPVRFCRRIKMVLEWSVFLWDDYDWDYVYIWRVLQYKLKRTRECIVSNGITMKADQVGKEIRVAENLLQRLIDDAYIDDDLRDYFEKYPMEWEDTPDGGRITRAEKKDLKRDRLFKAINVKETYLRKQDMEYLAKHMNKHIRRWWD
jgi:hypothetical protein